MPTITQTQSPDTAKKATSTSKKTKTATVKQVTKRPREYIVVDFPREGEIIYNQSFCIRLGVGENTHVEISINGGPWKPCRHSVGFWWFDWSGYGSGRHTILARVVTPSGNLLKTPPRTCITR